MTKKMLRKKLTDLINNCMTTKSYKEAEDKGKAIADFLATRNVTALLCAPGDTVYRIVNGEIEKNKVLQVRCNSVEWGMILNANQYVSFEEFNKTVFLKQETAEEKIANLIEK